MSTVSCRVEGRRPKRLPTTLNPSKVNQVWLRNCKFKCSHCCLRSVVLEPRKLLACGNSSRRNSPQLRYFPLVWDWITLLGRITQNHWNRSLSKKGWTEMVRLCFCFWLFCFVLFCFKKQKTNIIWIWWKTGQQKQRVIRRCLVFYTLVRDVFEGVVLYFPQMHFIYFIIEVILWVLKENSVALTVELQRITILYLIY